MNYKTLEEYLTDLITDVEHFVSEYDGGEKQLSKDTDNDYDMLRAYDLGRLEILREILKFKKKSNQ
tara:strand:+ start:1337 stop:1534 length:198 start_codon:yes stop_codon:yes gene_type:complete